MPEQVATVFRQMPIALAVNLVKKALVASVLTPVAGRLLAPPWFGAVALVTFARWLLWHRYRSGRGSGDSRRWAALAAGGALIAGVRWGVGCAWAQVRGCNLATRARLAIELRIFDDFHDDGLTRSRLACQRPRETTSNEY
jgi:hypothetical protein